MALNKKQASMATRIGIAIVAVILVISFVPGLFGLFGSSSDSTGSLSNLENIAAQFYQGIQTNQLVLQSQPTSYTVLVSTADLYYQWGETIQREKTAQQVGADLPLWVSAAAYYGRALAVKPGDPAVTTNYAISTFYSGDTAGAIAIVEPVMAANPTFGDAFYNAGIFYAQAGRNAEALAALQQSVALNPQATYVTDANNFIQQLQQQGAQSTPATSTTGTP